MLIVLGIVFLLGNMHMLSWFRIGIWFAHYWPVLLILWGIVKLIEHQQAIHSGNRAPGIGAGGVFLVIMIVVFGLIATQLEHVNWSGLRDNINIDDEDFNNLFGEKFPQLSRGMTMTITFFAITPTDLVFINNGDTGMSTFDNEFGAQFHGVRV